MAALLAVSGYFAAVLAGLVASWVFMPLVAGLALYLLERAGRAASRCWQRSGGRAGRRALAHPRPVRPQSPVRDSPARRRPGRVDRLSRTRAIAGRGFYPLLAVMLLSLAGAAARLDQPRVLFHLGIDHAVVLFPDLAEARGRRRMRCVTCCSRWLPRSSCLSASR